MANETGERNLRILGCTILDEYYEPPTEHSFLMDFGAKAP